MDSQLERRRRIFFAGDTHGDFGHVIKAVQKYRPAAVVFLGDLQPTRPLDQELEQILHLVEIWWIHGNHDTDSDVDYDNLFGSRLADRNLHARVVEIAGVRIAGLGGVFRGQVWMPPGLRRHHSSEDYTAHCGKGNRWRGDLPLRHRSTIFPAEYAALIEQRADILVTHEAPTAHPHGFAAIDELAHGLGVAKAFHGHHHEQLDYSANLNRLGFNAFGVGLHSIVDQDGLMIVPSAGVDI